MLASMWMALTKGAIDGPEADPGSVVRNIVYAHVPSAICGLLCFVVLLVAAIGLLSTSNLSWDRLALATAEVGTVFTIVMNVTGSIFSRAEWGIWWTPSPRLISAAMLWFLYVVYLILRSSLAGSEIKKARVCAVFAIIAFLDVPMVIYSARFMPDMHRANMDIDPGWPLSAFLLGMFSTMLFAAMLIWLRTDILKNKARLEKELS